MRAHTLSLSLVLFAAACGGGGGNPDAAPHPDSHPTIDAPSNPDAPQIADASTIDAVSTVDGAIADAISTVDGAIGDAVTTTDGGTSGDGGTTTDGGTAACLADPSYGTPTNQTASGAPSGLMEAKGDLNADIDSFDLALFAGYGAFAAGDITTGTFDIVGEETDYATCGLCPFVFADNANFTDDLFDTTRVYEAVSGQVTITSLSPNLTGHVDNLVLQHVTIDTSTIETTVVGDCQTTIATADFDAPVAPPALVGGPIHLRLHKPIRHH